MWCSRTCLVWKELTETRRRSTGQQPGTKSASRPADKPQINRLSTGGFVPAFSLHRMSLVRTSEDMFTTGVFDALEDTSDGGVLRGESCRRPMLQGPLCPAAPLCAAGPDPPVVCLGFGLDKFMMWCDVMWCDAVWCDVGAMWCYFTSSHVISCNEVGCGGEECIVMRRMGCIGFWYDVMMWLASMWCDVMPCAVMLCNVIRYSVLRFAAMKWGGMWRDGRWCCVIWWNIMRCVAKWCGLVWCSAICCDVLWCHVMPCVSTWCDVMQYDGVWRARCHVMWCGVVLFHLSNPKPGHTTGLSGRGGARRGGGAGWGWVGRDAVGSTWPGDNPPSCPPANREHCPERLFGSTNSLIRT